MSERRPSEKVVPIRPPDRALVRFRWMADVLASPQFSDAEARVLVRLALHQNVETGALFVGFEKLAAGSNQKKRKAIGAVTKAAMLGWLSRITRRGRGRSNSYNLKKVHGGAPFIRKGAPPGIETPSKRCTAVHPNREALTEGAEDRTNRPSMEELQAKYPWLNLKP